VLPSPAGSLIPGESGLHLPRQRASPIEAVAYEGRGNNRDWNSFSQTRDPFEKGRHQEDLYTPEKLILSKAENETKKSIKSIE
jgi:hypothetical protein